MRLKSREWPDTVRLVLSWGPGLGGNTAGEPRIRLTANGGATRPAILTLWRGAASSADVGDRDAANLRIGKQEADALDLCTVGTREA